jgi:hypothetical protein
MRFSRGRSIPAIRAIFKVPLILSLSKRFNPLPLHLFVLGIDVANHPHLTAAAMILHFSQIFLLTV